MEASIIISIFYAQGVPGLFDKLNKIGFTHYFSFFFSINAVILLYNHDVLRYFHLFLEFKVSVLKFDFRA